jgi:hypothetical protein
MKPAISRERKIANLQRRRDMLEKLYAAGPVDIVSADSRVGIEFDCGPITSKILLRWIDDTINDQLKRLGAL